MFKSVIAFLMVAVSLATSAASAASFDEEGAKKPADLECLIVFVGLRAGSPEKAAIAQEKVVSPFSYFHSDPYVAPDFAASIRFEKYSLDLQVSVQQAFELTDSNSKIFLPYYELTLADTANLGLKVLESASITSSTKFSTLYSLAQPGRQRDGSLITDVALTCKVQLRN